VVRKSSANLVAAKSTRGVGSQDVAQPSYWWRPPPRSHSCRVECWGLSCSGGYRSGCQRSSGNCDDQAGDLARQAAQFIGWM